MTMPTPALSVIVPTRNRADQLQGALERLAAQETGGQFTYEVLIVDNGSTDATHQVVEAWQPRFPVPLRYLYEGRAGRPWALNSGMAAARGAIFAFTDDDILTPPTWLAALWQCLQEEGADGVGGKILPQWTAPRPSWLTDEAVRKLGQLGCNDRGIQRLRNWEERNCCWVGGNLALRRSAIRRVGGYDVRMTRAQDTEYYERCVRHGLKICYEPAAVVSHLIGPERMTKGYFRRWRHHTGYHYAYLLPWRKMDLLTIVPLWWYGLTLQIVKRWLKNTVTHQPWFERFQDELVLRERASLWLHRLQLWPRWLLTAITGRPYLP